jgi:DNA polymerase-3 subunit epsilon/ATP-dependent DNA helicase DinG
MRTVLVALDLETTGLKADADAIIEIGAVKFYGDRLENQVIDSYRALINPERPIPPRVTAITGIRQEDVASAPRLPEAIPVLKRFVGDAPIVGHNINFDLDFLGHNGASFPNPVIDTYELASALLPTAPRYNLNALMQQLGLSVEGDYHSALTDCKATAQVYAALWLRLLQTVPLSVLRDVVNAARSLAWLGKLPFEAALNERLALPQARSEIDQVPYHFVLPEGVSPIVAELSSWDQIVEGTINAAFANAESLIIETPSGAESHRASLAAAARFAAEAQKRVIVAVSNAEQQARICDRELPAIQAALGLHLPVAALKGRAHYLCPGRLETLRRRAPTSIEELRLLAKVLTWTADGASGDQDDISLRGPDEYAAWNRFSAADENCALHRCEAQTGGQCPFYRAHQAAEAAPLVFVTHGSLVADTPGEDSPLPGADYVLVDEAHRLEETATFALGVRFDLAFFQRQLADLGTLESGLLSDVLYVARAALSEAGSERLATRLRTVAATIRDALHHGTALFRALADVLAAATNGRNDVPAQARLTADLREQSAFSAAGAVWTILREFTGTLAEVLMRLSDSMAGWSDRLVDTPDSTTMIQTLLDVQAGVRAGAQHLTAIHRQFAAAIEMPDSNVIYWLECFPDQATPTIRTAPLKIGPVLSQRVWAGRQSVVMSGTALTVSGSFDYSRERLGAPPVREIALSMPPEVSQQTLVYLPEDMPDVQEKTQHQRATERAIIELATAADGRLLALFTGYGQLRQTAQAIAPRLALGQITLFDQSDGTSQQALLDGFRTGGKGVLFGAKQFWSEIDLPPESLAALVISRLPFAAPGDPIVAARGELVGEMFADYSLPDAILRFRQGFDRLSRARTGQRGVVIVLDKRITSKSYGRAFLESLPPCTVRRGPLADLADAAKTWLTP